MRITRRQFRAGCAAAAGAAVYLAGSELGARKLRVSGLWLVTCAGLAGMTSVKSMSAHQRIDALVPQVASAKSSAASAQTTANAAMPKTGGTFSGAVTHSGTTTFNGAMNANGDFNLSGEQVTNGYGRIADAGGAPASYSQSYANSLNGAIINIINRLHDCGIDSS